MSNKDNFCLKVLSAHCTESGVGGIASGTCMGGTLIEHS